MPEDTAKNSNLERYTYEVSVYMPEPIWGVKRVFVHSDQLEAMMSKPRPDVGSHSFDFQRLVGSPAMKRLSFLPLGGLGEIGMNNMVLTWEGKRFLIDCGAMFPDDLTQFADIVLPDLEWLEAHADEFCGMILTHGHEDHIGAIPFVLRAAPMPVYGSRFTLGLVTRKLRERGIKADLREMPAAGTGEIMHPEDAPELGFSFRRVTHSIPDSAALVVNTPIGTIFHTGDFKIDERPVDGCHFDRDGLRALGDEGVLLMMSDSTNAQVPGRTISESTVLENIDELVANAPGRIFLSQFSSNLHRLSGIQKIADRHGRKLCLVGRSLGNYTLIAREGGIPAIDDSRLVDVEQLSNMDPEQLLLVVTGSQAERRATLSKLAYGQHTLVKLQHGDTVLMSSRVIPGNERPIYKMINELRRRGAEVVIPKAAQIHTSGHARQEELKEVINLIRPAAFVPVHGEYSFLLDHAKLARECGIEEVMVVSDGEEFTVDEDARLARGSFHTLNRHYLDGNQVGLPEELGFDQRRKLFFNGALAVHVHLFDNGEILTDVQTRGLYIEHGDIPDEAAERIAQAIAEMSPPLTDEHIENVAQIHARRVFKKRTGKKPVVMTFVTREAALKPLSVVAISSETPIEETAQT
ncbi:MAG: ribonuclease J [Myxococcota bacterium]|nr:ribonuclease J [Myxococcota bacterium]